MKLRSISTTDMTVETERSPMVKVCWPSGEMSYTFVNAHCNLSSLNSWIYHVNIEYFKKDNRNRRFGEL